MESKVKLFGHPVHPMLIVLPLGLLSTAVVFDIVYLLTDEPAFSTVAFWNIAAGIVGGLLAAVFGAWDWMHIPRETRAKRIGLWHGGGNVVVVVLFALSWLLRAGAVAVMAVLRRLKHVERLFVGVARCCARERSTTSRAASRPSSRLRAWRWPR